MLKVNVISDLHLEFGDLTLPGGDVLVLAGDACEARHLQPGSPCQRFFLEECAKYRHVVYVLGNHEHYGSRYDDTLEMVRQAMPQNVHVLENQTVEIDGVWFLGATLWTDLNQDDPITERILSQHFSDYHVIRKDYRGATSRLIPLVTATAHAESMEYFKNQLESLGSVPIVVVTHHMPSARSTHPRFAHDYHMNGGFRSHLDEFILQHANIQVWCHGHTHDFYDYHIGTTRIICNPRGYVPYESRAQEFDPTVGFEI